MEGGQKAQARRGMLTQSLPIDEGIARLRSRGHHAAMHALTRRLSPILVALLCSGCLTNRLDGPIHSADGMPWIANGAGVRAPALALDHRVLLVGDAGLWLEEDPTLAALGEWAETAPASTTLFLGDNLYNEGLRDDDRERGEKILKQQLAATGGRKIFVPGNHDWGLFPSSYSVRAIRNQQELVDGWPDGSAAFLPKDGCMGPVARELAPAAPGRRALVAVLADPTPWLNENVLGECPEEESYESHVARLDEVLTAHADDWVILATHYPILTGGPHGGLTYGFFIDLLLGILTVPTGGRLANTYEPGYADWIEAIEPVLRAHPPIVYAAGHDHNLQVLDADGRAGAFVVSGAGAVERVSTVTHLPETLFAHAHPGFVVLDFGRRDGREVVLLRVVEAGKDAPVFERELVR